MTHMNTPFTQPPFSGCANGLPGYCRPAATSLLTHAKTSSMLTRLPQSRVPFQSIVFAILILVTSFCASAQNTSQFSFTNVNTGSFLSDRSGNAVSMASGTSPLVGASIDDGSSAVTNIGFTFTFAGTQYTQFSASSNGAIRLGATAMATAAYGATFPVASVPIIAPYWGDLSTSSTGKVHYKLVGTAPNRTLVVEFLNMNINYSSATVDGTFQARLYEQTNVIEFIYGGMKVNGTTTANSQIVAIGFSNNTGANNQFSLNQTTYASSISATAIKNTNSTTGTLAGLNGTTDGARRSFTFTPNLPYHAQFLSMSTGATTWCAGETRTISVTVKNIGTATWTNSAPDVNIGLRWNINGTNWADYHIRTDANGLAPGATGTYNFTITASNNAGSGYTTPLAAGTNNLNFDLVKEADCWFGDNAGSCGPGNLKYASANQTINLTPSVTLGTNPSVCQGVTSANLPYTNAVGSPNQYSITYDAAAISAGFTNVVNGTPTATPLVLAVPATAAPAVYNATLTIRNSATGCTSASYPFTLTVNAVPTITLGTVPPQCKGLSSAGLSYSGLTGAANQYSIDYDAAANAAAFADVTNASLPASPISLAVPVGAGPGTYNATLTVRNSSTGCVSSLSSFSITINAPAVSFTGPSTICEGGTTTLSPTTGGTWASSNAGLASVSNDGSVTSLGGGGTVTFTFTETASGCSNSTGGLVINANSTIILSSSAGTDAQTKCINTAITNITYQLGGGATGASVTGGALPAGVTASYNSTSKVFTISGTPTVSGAFTYDITTAGLCINPTASGSINVTPASAIALTSGNNIQTVCIDNAIGDITYNISGNATGAAITSGSLPAGVTGIFDGQSQFVISGTPSVSGVFNYTVSSTGPCPISLTGTITVNANSTILLTSAAGTDAQSKCINNAITVISYTIGAGGTGASISAGSLPAGITGSYNAGTKVFSISGTPTVAGVFAYSVTTAGPCINATLNGSITVIGNSTISLTSGGGTNTQTVCQQSAITTITYAIGGTATGASASGLPAGVTGVYSAGVFTISGTPTGSGVFNYLVATAGPCVNPTSGGTITVNAQPTGVTVTPATRTICAGTSVNLVATGATNSTGVLVNDNFNGTPTFAAAGSTTGSNSQIFTKETSGTNVNSAGTITSPNGGSFMAALSAAPATFGTATSSANSTLTSPAINTNGYATLTLTYNHTYKQANVSGSGKVEVSTNGTTWVTLKTFSSNQGGATAFVADNINLAATYLNQPSLRIRFNYAASGSSGFASSHSYWWVIDDVFLNGQLVPFYSWTASTAAAVNGLPASASTASLANANITVAPTATTVYTLTAQNPVTNCGISTATSTITVNDPPVITSQPNSATVCEFGSASYSVLATGTGITYQWRKGTANLVDGGSVSGATTSTLTINPVSTSDAASNYNVVVSGTAPCTPATSQNVSLVVNTAPGLLCTNQVTNTDADVCHATRTYSSPSTGSPAPTVTYSVNGNAITFPYEFPVGITTVDVLATGACAPDATCSFTVTVTDAQAPTANLPALPVITGECAATIPATPTATDACDGLITGTTSDPLSYTTQGTYSVHWSYTDTKGNISTQVQTVIVDDITAPAADEATLVTITGECTATVTATPTATDNCVGSVTGTTTDPLTYNTQGTHTITWNYNDGNGNISTQTQTVVIHDVTAPVADLAVLPTITGECAATVPAAPTATDNCSGSIIGTTADPLTYNTQGTHIITWNFNDGNGNVSTQTQTVIVEDVTAPVADVSVLPDATGECSVTVTAPTATDACVGTVTGTTTDPVTYNTQGTFSITWTYNDGNGNLSTQTQTVVVDDVTAPLADVANLATVTGECSANVSAPTATDNCVGSVTGTTTDPVTYNNQGTYTINWTYDDGQGNTSSQTQTVIVNDVTAPVADLATLPTVTGECSATVTGTPTATDACVGAVTGTTTDPLTYNTQGTFTITWAYNDGNGNVSTQQQLVVVDDITAPVADEATLPTVTGECNATVSAPPTATDNCVGSVTGTTSDPLTYNTQGTYTITWSYNDGNGNTSTQTQTVVIRDVTAPVADLAVLPIITGECAATVPAAPTATDNCAGSIIGTTADPLTYNTQGSHIITWSFNDGNGNVSTQTQTVIVDDVTAPVADVSVLPNATGECSVTVEAPTATDNCIGSVTGTTADPLTYTTQGTFTINWSYDDGNGNISTQTQTVIVHDVTAPVANIASLPNATGECSVTLTAPSATDNCVGAVIGTTTDPLTYSTQGTYNITWSYNDGNGNISSQTQTVVVSDVTAPVATLATLPNATGECSVTVTDAPTATDNCVGTVTGTTADPLTYNTQGTFVINWTYNDGNGNTSTQTQTVVVNDVTAPVINCPASQSFCAVTGNQYVIPALSATDNCALGAISYSITGATVRSGTGNNASGTFNPGISTIVWSVSDMNNNVSTCSTSVSISLPPATPAIVYGPTNVCPYIGTGEQVTYSIDPVTYATGYLWTVPSTITIVSGQNTNSLTVTINSNFDANPSPAGKLIKVRSLSACGNSDDKVLYLLAQFPSTPGTITGPTNVCALIGTTNTATYKISKVTAATSYLWSTPAGTTSVLHPEGPGINDTVIVVTYGAGFTTSSITVAAANGCGTSGSVRSLLISRTAASTPGLISGPTNVCANILPNGTAATYSIAPVTGATSYTWTVPANAVVTHPNGAGENDYSITVQFPSGFTNGSIGVTATNGCGTSGLRSLNVTRLNPGTPSVVDVIQTQSCPNRQYSYTLSAVPLNSTSVQWTIPVSQGAVLVSQTATSITVSYPATAVNGTITVQSFNNCGSSSVRTIPVKLGVCAAVDRTIYAGTAPTVKAGVQPLPLVADGLNVKIFPNPTVSDFKLQVLTSGNEPIQVRILDVQGRQYRKVSMDANRTINLGADLKAGVYFIEVRQRETVKVTKVVKF